MNGEVLLLVCGGDPRKRLDPVVASPNFLTARFVLPVRAPSSEQPLSFSRCRGDSHAFCSGPIARAEAMYLGDGGLYPEVRKLVLIRRPDSTDQAASYGGGEWRYCNRSMGRFALLVRSVRCDPSQRTPQCTPQTMPYGRATPAR